MKTFAKAILKLWGWKISGEFTPEIQKCVLVIAPHTSNWDFVIGRIAFWYLKMDVKFLMKKEAFRGPMRPVLKWLGNIPVDRKNSMGLINQVAELLKVSDSLVVTITPEGTRGLNYNWKKGFYQIAKAANVPMVLGYLDYKKKEGGFSTIIYPSDNFEADFTRIKEFYMNVTAKYPENFSLSPENRKENN